MLSIIGANEPTEKAGCIWTGGRLLSRIGLEIYAKTTCSFRRFIMMVKLKALKFVSGKIMRVNG